MSTELVVPPILLDPRTAEALEPTPENAVAVLHAVREQGRMLKDARQMATEVLLDEARRQGAKTLHVGGFKAEIRASSELHWDLEILGELRTLGLPEERWHDLVTETVSYHVNAVVAKQLAAANEQYARIVEAARKTIEKTPYVSVTES